MTRALVALLALSSTAGGGEAPVFVLETISTKPVRGPLAALTERGDVRIVGQIEAVPAKDWVSLRRVGMPLPPSPVGPHVNLTIGDCLPFVLDGLSLTADRLSFSCPWLESGKPARAALSSVALLWRTAPGNVEAVGSFRRKLLAEQRRRDAVLLRNGDTVEGVLARVGEKQIEIEVNRRPVAIEMSQVAVVALSSVLASTTRPKDAFARVVLADGTRVSLRPVYSDGKSLRGTTLFGAAFEAPLDKVVAIDLLQGQAVYLSDLKPSRYSHTPYLGVSWPLVVDGSAAGGELRLGGNVFDRGLGMHSAARVTYAVPAGCRYFEARAGLDDVTGRAGSARLSVVIDGKERDLGRKRDLTHRDGLLPVRLEVAGAKELTLVVDFGQGGDVGDHVNWAEARFLR